MLCFEPDIVSGGGFDGGRKGGAENRVGDGVVFAGGFGGRGEVLKSLNKLVEIVGGGWLGIGVSDGAGPKLENDRGAG